MPNSEGPYVFRTAVDHAIERIRTVSGADLIALYPYDDATDVFYAPASIGIPEGDVVRTLPDLIEQIRHFRQDEAEGKVPEDLLPSQYGPNAWILTKRRPLITADAQHEVDTSFVRRHGIQAIVGLPLIVGGRVVGLVFLNYTDKGHRRKRPDVTASEFLQRVEEEARDVAACIDAARHTEELETLEAVSALIGEFSAIPTEIKNEGMVLERLHRALERVLDATQLDATAVFVGSENDGFNLIASRGCPALAREVLALPPLTADEIMHLPDVASALEEDGLSPVSTRSPHQDSGHVLVMYSSHDILALERRPPVARSLLQTTTDLLGAMVSQGQILDALGESNRALGAVTRLGTRLLEPGASQDDVLDLAVNALTDPGLPELDFEFAAFFLVETRQEGLVVAHSVGATRSPAIDSVADAGGDTSSAHGRRTPRWVTVGERQLDPRDIISYVVTRRRPVVVEALEANQSACVIGYPEDRLERLKIPLQKSDGSKAGEVRAVRLREAADRAPLHTSDSPEASYRGTDELSLDADMFAEYGHGAIVRVFMPFGPIHTDGTGKRATGVLEAGFHISRQTQLQRVQIEALRACATTLASAVETARLYEEATTRARQLEIDSEVSKIIATSIDLEQTLNLVARNMARSVEASLCLIALLDEDGSAWYGAAASSQDDVWRRRRVERPERSIVFEVAEHECPIVVEEALHHELVSPYMARLLGIRSLVALPLLTPEGAIGAVILAEQERRRRFTPEEVDRASGLAGQAAMAIRNARLHSREEEEQHIQKDVVLIGFGQWGQKAYKHLVLLKNFFNFRTHVIEVDSPGRRESLAEAETKVLANGDLFYWDSAASPAYDALSHELEPSCYVITYIATPAETHLPTLKTYYDVSNVVLIEKPLGAPPEEYREFLDRTDGAVQLVAADHYWFKIEVRLLQLLLTEERNLRAFLDEIEEVEVEILEEQPPGGSGAQIGMIADLVPHALAILSLLTPLDHLELLENLPLQVGRYQPLASEHETYARLAGCFEHRGRKVKVTIDVGKGVVNAKSIKLIGPRRMGGRKSFYKFDFTKGEAMDGTQSALRAATRPIRQPGVPDNAHLSMLRHVIEKKHPAVGILSIREALRANVRIRALEHMGAELVRTGQWVPYEQGQRPHFAAAGLAPISEVQENAGAVSGR